MPAAKSKPASLKGQGTISLKAAKDRLTKAHHSQFGISAEKKAELETIVSAAEQEE